LTSAFELHKPTKPPSFHHVPPQTAVALSLLQGPGMKGWECKFLLHLGNQVAFFVDNEK
jgi:hypothetical protein